MTHRRAQVRNKFRKKPVSLVSLAVMTLILPDVSLVRCPSGLGGYQIQMKLCETVTIILPSPYPYNAEPC